MREEVPIDQAVRKGVFWDGGEWGKGTPWTIDPKSGQAQVPRGYKPPEDTSGVDAAKQQASQLNLQKAKAAYAAKLMGITNPNAESNEPLYTKDEAWAEAEQRFGGGQSQQPGQTQQNALGTLQQSPVGWQQQGPGATSTSQSSLDKPQGWQPQGVYARPQSKEEFDRLPSGSIFLVPGTEELRRKP
jgi:hypothetical protein